MTVTIPDLDQDAFKQIIENATLPVLIDVWASWCTSCAAIAPVLESLASERAGALHVAKLDAGANPALAADLGARSLPTLLLYKDGAMIASRTGAAPRSVIARFVDDALAAPRS